ncbi:MAG: DUF3347 domain-containing protein [Flavobacteriales bacterium]
MNFIFKIFFIVLFSLSLMQCKTQKLSKTEKPKTEHNHDDHDHSTHDHGDGHDDKYMAKRTEADDMESQRLDVVFYTYFKIKNGLADSSFATAANYAGSLYRATQNVNSDSLNKTEAAMWAKNSNSIKTHAAGISNSEDVVEQRIHMAQLSIKMLGMMRMIQPDSRVYVFICKDWNNNTGALWLSKENDVAKNPYQKVPKRNCGRFMQIIE